MTPADASQLLILIAAYDNRTFDKTTATVWADALDRLDVADCVTAIRQHYRRSKDWLMPSDIRAAVRPMIAARRQAEADEYAALTAGSDLPDHGVRLRKLIDACYRMPAEGEPSPHPKTAGDGRVARAVACPWCRAPVGSSCTNTATGERSGIVHEKRLQAAGVAPADPTSPEPVAAP